MTRRWLTLAALLLALTVIVEAQVAPGVFDTLKTTDPTALSLCVGCPLATTVPAPNSGATLATLTVTPTASPTITTAKLYNIAGGLYWNGVAVSTGSTVIGTPLTLGMFTGPAAIGNSILTQNAGATAVTVGGGLSVTGPVTAPSYTGSGAGLTGIPTTALTGNYVASVTAGTGLTSSVPTGSGANTIVSLNNTAVVPGAYPYVTVDQQGRVTAASTTVVSPAIWNAGPVTATVTAGTNTPGVTITTALSGAGLALNNTNADPGARNWGIAGNYNVYGDFVIVQGGTAGSPALAGGVPRLALSPAGSLSLGLNITDAVAVPTIASGFMGATIAGKDYAFVVTPTSSALAGGVVNFNATYANPPVCVASAPGRGSPVLVSTTTTQATFTTTPGDLGVAMHVLCRGY